MTPELSILLAVSIPLLGAILILVTGKFPNVRETVTLATAVLMFLVVSIRVSICPEEIN